MKKILFVLLGVLIGVLASYYCFNCKQTETTTMAIVKPKGVITPAQARVLNANWTKTRKQAVDSAAGRPDNRSSWWSLKDIQNYLTYAESQADSLGYTLNGIRIYQGVYSGNAPNGKADYSTVFWVPTGKKGGSKASMLNFSLQDSGDIDGADLLNEGGIGRPPGSDFQ